MVRPKKTTFFAASLIYTCLNKLDVSEYILKIPYIKYEEIVLDKLEFDANGVKRTEKYLQMLKDKSESNFVSHHNC